jgi:hypothetical protein
MTVIASVAAIMPLVTFTVFVFAESIQGHLTMIPLRERLSLTPSMVLKGMI